MSIVTVEMFGHTITAITYLIVLEYRYRRTSETLSQAGQKASAAFSSVGTAITKKFEDVKYDLYFFPYKQLFLLLAGGISLS